eukprot:TRINITY_DN2969_c0_g1_i2.p1 TRINITY_DN2969_c0_g1~~TRINITY_DN2969_c0_g1_i2.p1  ORF type:complete len:344 (+),score=18.31 TRINITY_DN2969_c0_g1_i2:43-1074(+)
MCIRDSINAEYGRPGMWVKGYVGILVVFCICWSCYGSYDERVRLTDVTALTLHYGKQTNGRRSSPVPQLKCVGGSARSEWAPEIVQCRNVGSDGIDVQWECQADMPTKYKFGQISVSCEGYDYPEDPYILAGSCGLEYTLDRTSQYYDNYDHHPNDYEYETETYDNYEDHNSAGWGSFIVKLILCGIGAFLALSIYRSCMALRTTPASGHSYGGSSGGGPYGGGPGGGPGYGTGLRPPGCTPSAPYAPSAPYTPRHAGGGSWWQSMALGGMLGYLFGGRRGYGGGYNRGYGGYNRGYGGYNRGYGGYNSGYTAPRATRTRTRTSRPSSSTTRTARSFGGTTRR